MIRTLTEKRGFTLIELMVVVSIIIVLAAIAIPLYSNYVYRGKQVEAKTLLMTLKVEQEQFRAENNCYTTNVVNLPETNRLYPRNRVYITAPVITGAVNTTGCAAGLSPVDDFKAVVTGTLASGHAVDRWGISDTIPAAVHCDSRWVGGSPEAIACGSTTTEMEY
ncbi:MAG TPA: prepilin-type N-terminal cleavage/methylation domain-containing protein [Anaerolineales bacterium]|nr:prepilin-type N-terminal cleavage/methylation domain-containing protein [Anaerolineales bacterium]